MSENCFFIGNDVVDLCEKSNIRSFNKSRYLQKISISKEVELISDNLIKIPFLWSAKEAAYKAVVKNISGIDIFFPKDFVIIDFEKRNQFIYSNVKYIPAKIQVCIKTFIHHDYYHSIACNTFLNINKIKYSVEKLNFNIPLNESEQVRALLFSNLKTVSGYDDKLFTIDNQKKPYPMLIHPLNNHIDISLSHDGNYIAYAFIIC